MTEDEFLTADEIAAKAAGAVVPTDEPTPTGGSRQRLSAEEIQGALTHLLTKTEANMPTSSSLWWAVSDAIDSAYNSGEVRSVAVGRALDKLHDAVERRAGFTVDELEGSFSAWCQRPNRTLADFKKLIRQASK